MGNNPQGVGLA